MTADSLFVVMCGGMIALLLGLMLCFGGYRLFLVLLPIWGFFFGFTFGAQAVQAILGQDFLATVTSWVVGFVFAALFAIVAYAAYLLAVAVLSFSLGYFGAAGLLMLLGLPLMYGFTAWLIALLAGIGVAFVVLRFNIQKIMIELATAFLGAGAIVSVFVLLFGSSVVKIMENPMQYALSNSPFWLIVLIALGVVGFALQFMHNRHWETEVYNRLSTKTAAS